MAASRFLATALLLAAAGWPAAAVDWSLVGSVSETLSLNTNSDLDAQEDGLEFGSDTSLNLTLGADTPRTTWRLSTGFDLSVVSNSDDNDDLDGIRPNLNGTMQYRGLRYTLSNSLSLRQDSSASLRFREVFADDDEGEAPPDLPTDFAGDRVRIEDNTDRITIFASSRLSYQLTPRDSATFGLSSSTRRFLDDVAGLSDSQNFGTSLSWSHRLDPVSSTGLSFNFLRFTSEDTVTEAEERGINLSLSGQYSTQPSPRLSLGSSLGVNYTRSTDDIPVAGGTVEDEDSDIGGTGSLSLTLRHPNSQTNLALSQAVRPSSFGDVRNVSSLSMRYSQRLTARTSFTFGGNYTLEKDVDFGGTPEHFFGAGPSISYTIAPQWTASLSYRLRGVTDSDTVGETGVDLSHSLAFTIGYGFTLLP